MPRLNITIPEDVYARLDRWRDRINLSRISAEAITRELGKLEQVPDDIAGMQKALSRLGNEKAKVDRACFRIGVSDGLEWARRAEYADLKTWGQHAFSADSCEVVLNGPAARAVEAHAQNATWERMPYVEGWLAGVNQFWQRVQKHL